MVLFYLSKEEFILIKKDVINILAVIPARGGSKGIPKKNIRLMNRKPLISYSINNAINSKYIMDVFVSTDSDEIAEVASDCGAEIIKRSAVQFSSFAFFFSAYSSSVLSVPLTLHIVNEESDSFITIVIIQTASPGDNIFFLKFF